MTSFDFDNKISSIKNDIAENNVCISSFGNGSEYSVDVSIEPNHECEILEIKYDGQEIYKENLTYSENLAKLISKIDFVSEVKNVTEKELNEDSSQSKTENNENSLNLTHSKFFQSIYEKLKLSHDEVCVLLDCLTLARANKQMGIEIGRESFSSYNDDKQSDVLDKTLSVILKKKNIEKAKSLLRKSLEKLSSDQEIINERFHFELYYARQKWRIKKIGERFFCDLSYRSVGCINSLKANVELLRNESKETKSFKNQNLNVTIPEELQNYAFIKIEILSKKSKSSIAANFSLFNKNLWKDSQNKDSVPSWQYDLEKAQNAIFCKEIFYQLMREIFDPQNSSHLKPIITGNSIQIMLTINYDLIISIIHCHDKQTYLHNCPKIYNFDNALLEYYLHSLLKKSFDQNFFHYDQRPITSTFAYNSQIKLAGLVYSNLNIDEEDSLISLPHNINHLINKKKKINLLVQIKEKAIHLLLRKRIMHILGKISIKVKEPYIQVEPTAWNNSTSTDIILTISSYYYEALAKSSFYIMIKKSNIKILNRFSNISVTFNDNLKDLKNYFLDQCIFHQINLITALSQMFGWTILGNSFTNEPNMKRMCGIALLYNNKYLKKIGIKISPVNHIEVYVNQYAKNKNDNNSFDTNFIKDQTIELNLDWIYIKDNFTKVDFESYPGVTKIQKFELLLANLSTSDYILFNN